MWSSLPPPPTTNSLLGQPRFNISNCHPRVIGGERRQILPFLYSLAQIDGHPLGQAHRVSRGSGAGAVQRLAPWNFLCSSCLSPGVGVERPALLCTLWPFLSCRSAKRTQTRGCFRARACPCPPLRLLPRLPGVNEGTLGKSCRVPTPLPSDSHRCSLPELSEPG